MSKPLKGGMLPTARHGGGHHPQIRSTKSLRRTTSSIAKSRTRMGWMFPILAVMSLMMNGSMHLRRLHRVSRGASSIERGPPATTVSSIHQGQQQAQPPAIAEAAIPETLLEEEEEMDDNSPFGYIAGEIRRQMKTQSDYPASTYTLGLKKKKTKGKAPGGTKKTPQQVAKAVNAISGAGGGQKSAEVAAEFAATIDSDKRSTSVSVSANANDDVTFSACLLIRDDNDILNEWIAYHYHVLNMKRLIVAVDPGSETSPAAILDPWRDTMEIDLWNDDDYMPNRFLDTGIPPAEDIKNLTKFKDVSSKEMMEINVHRYRQRVFLTECFKQVKEEKRTWAVHVDTDEYVVPNKFLRQDHGNYATVPSSNEPGSILKLVQQLVATNSSAVNYPCITMIRLLFGSVETVEEDWKVSIPSGFERKQFETLRWRHHGPSKDKKMHGYPKVLVDVSKIPKRHLDNDIIYSIHRPFQKFCRGMGDVKYSDFEKFPITTNHYLGSWERYNARNDKRRSWDVYSQKANQTSGQDTWVDGWLDGFINNVGKEKAAHLLGQHYLDAGTVAAAA